MTKAENSKKNTSIINGNIYSTLIISGANNLINNKNRIDALNVFPVPDGDTGTNMSSTVEEAVKALKQSNSAHLGEVSTIVSKNMLLGARGNSGVILSQIFKGFATYFADKKEIDINDFIKGFRSATERAYQSVLKPVEGTILTVIRETTENLEKNISNIKSFEQLLDLAKEFSRTACDNTPSKLKILREVGVVDSGGEGLATFIAGMQSAIYGNNIEIADTEMSIDKFISSDEVYSGEFGYCTEFIIELKELDEFNKKSFEKAIAKKANSLVVVQDNELLKVHGHTLKPGDLLNFAQKYGEFIKIKSENMTLQAESTRNKNVVINDLNIDSNRKCAIISCNLGSGIIQRMKDLGCDVIVESGQTQNPSAADIIEAIKSIEANDIFILPNNSNIFLTAEQAATTINDKNIHIIHTKSQIQGINAMLAFNKDSNAEENQELMDEVMQMVKTGEVTKAIRDTNINGIKIKKDEFISILDGKIVSCKPSYLDAAKQLIKETATEDTEVITIYYGDEATEPDANELSNYISRYYDCEVQIVNGNQPNYHFLIGFE
ncbi:DAK2 domain-containing protein [Mycoplasmopsis primatum]|uniref:DAK2 domain-containing protein n=1 Tax=Mycoplasmopsis primatum TaxID=55604 RepID=UPI0004968CF5|nr:DAK2 domain-containing protein [Mycoplasmopsis primatum]